ncbi:hypothetical protein GOP47_0025818 [Adiantum capillus-veneris]|uniref:Uncharacterized protein n=1 Tax=Adiantum capillus-veneris TaxID=13818 RepID=A0A9D4Z393_ADICA|nr:hypothetical protein GOP47_0025818 [Adiantum capillus-veneris]
MAQMCSTLPAHTSECKLPATPSHTMNAASTNESSPPHILSLVKPAMPKSDLEALDLLESLTHHADHIQAETLSAILQRNAHTEYLGRYGLEGRTDRQSFKSLLPMITYEDLQPEIQRIANGDTSPILSAHPVSEFLTSSGTSAGERKLMPTIHDEFERRCLLYSFLMPIMNQYVPDLDKGKGMYFYFIKSEVKTPGGLPARPVLTSYYKSHWFTERPYNRFNVCTSPNETVLCPDAFQSMYCQMLCGLLHRADVLRMGAVFASGFLRAIRFLQDHWQQLCNDIRTGELSDAITHEPSRQAVANILASMGPTAEQADEIALICNECQEKSSWKGIIPLIWPRTKYIDVIVTGAMAQYIPTLNMYSGGLPLVCTMYASSECYFGVNLHPLCKPCDVSYTLIPNMAYFEFLPVSSREGKKSHKYSARKSSSPNNSNEAKLVELVDVQVGCEYELVVTTYAGLYRYKVGDILRVTGFHNKAPQFEFVCRKNVALSIDADKTDEDTLHRAVEAATRSHLIGTGVTLVEYTSYVDLSTIPAHYVLFWELEYSTKAVNISMEGLKAMLEECCWSIEEKLDSVYRQGRVSDRSIGPLEIRVVKKGSFEALMDYCLSRGASINQYKAPRCVKATPIIELMNCRVGSSYLSPCCPNWSPS